MAAPMKTMFLLKLLWTTCVFISSPTVLKCKNYLYQPKVKMDPMIGKWKLLRYSHQNTKESKKNKHRSWNNVSGGGLYISLTKANHLLITQDTTFKECFALWGSKSWMRAIVKRDSLLIMYKRGDGRLIRVCFAPETGESGIERCIDCANRLKEYFPVQMVQNNEKNKKSLDGEPMEVTLAQLPAQTTKGQIDAGDLQRALPAAYMNCHMTADDLEPFIRLCLMDSSFPSFVGQVEKTMKKVVKK